MAKSSKHQFKKRKQAKPKFTSKTRLFDLVRKEHHGELKKFVCEVSGYLEGCDPANWKNLARFNVDYGKCRKSDFIMMLAKFLFTIDKSEGLKCSLRVFCQYLSKTEHSNFGLKQGSIKTQIIRMLNYIEEHKKEDKKW